MKNKKPTNTNNDEVNILDFKPLSTGLGFHKKKDMEPAKMVRKVATKPVATISQTPIKTEQAKLFTAGLGNSLPKTPTATKSFSEAALPVSISKMAAAFDATAASEKTLIFPGQITRLAAWIFDLIFLMASVVILAFIIQFLSGESESQILAYRQDIILNLYLPIFVFTYLFYFTLTERIFSQSLGKASLKIKVQSANFNGKLTLFQTLLRSTLTLLNLVSCGFIAYYDIHNKIAQTLVIEEN
jgi:uncharacterized RDD family membrane protein YckC